VKINDKVYISGEVEYGNDVCRVASIGIVEEMGDIESLIAISNIDGDFNVTTYVLNKYINEIGA
jgi:hypothetical protein